MPKSTLEKNPEQIVKERYPTAYEYDDGEKVIIRFLTQVTEKCPTCHQKWTHHKVLYPDVLGTGGNSMHAWKNAAHCIGLK